MIHFRRIVVGLTTIISIVGGVYLLGFMLKDIPYFAQASSNGDIIMDIAEDENNG